MSEKNFKFYVPVELTKSENDDETWHIQGIASTADEDLQGETVDQDGLDISLLKAGRGLFNFDHQKGPENVLGQIEDAEFVKQDGKKCLMVKGYLFKHQDRAKAFYNILKSLKKGASNRVQMSIEGKIIQRDFANQKAIKKARIDKVALTLDPVNPYTYAELVKSLNSDEIIKDEPEAQSASDFVTIEKADLEKLVEFAQKALSAGAGGAKAPEARSGGEAMSKESLEQAPKNITHQAGKKNKKKAMVRSLMKSLKEMYPSHDPMELAEMVVESIVDRLGEDKN
jgi:hypothetical protein